MPNKRLFLAVTVTLSVLYTDMVAAAPLTLSGNFISVAINDETGTLGSGNETGLGLKFDRTGSGNFSNDDDFISPDIPYDNIVVSASNPSFFTSDPNGRISNNNAPGFPRLIFTDSFSDLSTGSTNSAQWTGIYADFDTSQEIFSITNLYSFDDNDQRIRVTTTITALTDLTDLTFLRSVDPDQDENDPASFTDNNTINVRGSAAEGIAANDIVTATGPGTGLTLSLFSDSEVAHNTGITFPWSDDPNLYLNGVDQSNGESSDSLIGIAFDIGTLNQNQTISFTYDFALGTVTVPVPGAAWLFVTGIAGLFFKRGKNRIDTIPA